MSEDLIGEVSEQSEDQVPPLTLRESIFSACDNIQVSGKKISRPLVRKQVGQVSDRNIDNYVNEWREHKKSQSLVHHQINQSDINITQDISVTDIGEERQNITPNRQIHREIITQMGAKLASEILIGESLVASYLLENPDKLPAEFQDKVRQARARLDATIGQIYQQQTDLEELAKSAIAELNHNNIIISE